MMVLLGRTAALDCFVGNDDRLLSSFNPDNFMVHVTKGRQVMSLIDNSDGIMSQFTGEEFVFRNWLTRTYMGGNGSPYRPIQLFVNNEIGELANHIVSIIINQSLTPGHSAASEDILGGMEEPLLKNRAKMTENFVEGLAEARAGLVGGIGILMNTMKRNLEMTERERYALRDLTARFYTLRGRTPDEAWNLAVAATTVQLPVPQQPPQEIPWQRRDRTVDRRGGLRLGSRPRVNN